MAKFKQGKSGNPAGRPQGAGNKISVPIKTQLFDFLNDKIQELPAIWEKLTPRDKAQFIKDLWPYYMAKLQSIEVQTEFDTLTDDQLDKLYEKVKRGIYGQEGKN